MKVNQYDPSGKIISKVIVTEFDIIAKKVNLPVYVNGKFVRYKKFKNVRYPFKLIEKWSKKKHGKDSVLSITFINADLYSNGVRETEIQRWQKINITTDGQNQATLNK